MKIVRIVTPPFENKMTKRQTVLGWIYLPLHMIVIPLLLSLYLGVNPDLDTGSANLLYYGIGVLFTAVVMLPFLRSAFDVLLDRLGLCVACILIALLADYAMSTVAALILLLLENLPQNPNNAAVMAEAAVDPGIVTGLAVFIAPIVEELLFRGVVFGSIRTRSRGWAYAVSIAVFALYHVWEYAIAGADLGLLVYAIQYVPAAAVLAWLYERSGSIWTGIFFHMGNNLISMIALSLLEKL